MFSLNTNISDLILQRTLLDSTYGLNEAINRMTTGFKVNHAKDNAAGYSIVENLNTKISSMLQVQQNAADGISLLSTAEAGLTEIQGLLERLRELTVQASTGTYDSKSRESMQAEADALLEEINRIKNSIEYDGRNLYETPRNNAVARLAQSAKVCLNNTAGEAFLKSFTPLPADLNAEEDLITSSSSAFYSGINEGVSVTSSEGQPTQSSNERVMMMSMARSASPASATIDGSVDFAASETKTITIDGVNYEVTNRQQSSATLSYSKDADGVLSFNGNYFTITGQDGVSHNLYISGLSNIIYGGNLSDIITSSSVGACTIYGQGGDDTIHAEVSTGIHGGDGDDNITVDNGSNGYFYGDAGNDTFTITSAVSTSSYYGGNDDDTFIINGGGKGNLFGQDGDDKFEINAGNYLNIDGGSGTNIVTKDNGSYNVKANVVGANAGSVDFATKNEIKVVDIEVNGTNYSYKVTNLGGANRNFVYKINDDGEIEFTSTNFKIEVVDNNAHKVKLSGANSYFYGGEQGDTITCAINTLYVYSKGGNDNILLSGDNVIQIDAGDGDDIITGQLHRGSIYSGAGNDTLNLSSSTQSYVDTGDDDDNVTFTSAAKAVAVYGGSGTNTINNLGTDIHKVGFGNADNMTGVLVEAGKTVEVDLNGSIYNITNSGSYDKRFIYSIDDVTKQITFNADSMTVETESPLSQDLITFGRNTYVYTGSGDDIVISKGFQQKIYTRAGNDKITNMSNDTAIYAGEGNDEIIVKSIGYYRGEAGNDIITIDTTLSTNWTVNGGEGDDTYNLNKTAAALTDSGGNNVYNIHCNNAVINGSSGADSFYIHGDGNTVNGQGGEDYFEVFGTGNTLNGETAKSTFVINANNNTISATDASDAILAPEISLANPTPPANITVSNTPTILFISGDEQIQEINGLNYKFTNLSGDSNNKVTYVINENTGLVTFTSSEVQIDCIDNSEYKFSIRGDNNIVNGGSLSDKITIEHGENNTIYGNAGNDIIINDSANNIIYGGANDDTITLNQTASYVDGEGGNDTINVKSDNNAEINTGTGDDKLVISGSNNTIEAQDGNNNINITGSANVVNANDGDNKVVVAGNDNEVTIGNGDNTFGISGDGNTVGSLHTVGNLNINGDENTVVLGNVVQIYSTGSGSAFNGNITVNGNDNVILQEAGNNTVTIKGSGNEYTSNGGEKDITATGSGNALNTSDGNDKITVKGNANTVTTTGGNNTLTITGNSNQIQGGTGIDTMKISGNMNTAMGGDGNDSFTLSIGSNNIIDGEGGARNTMVNYSSGINHTNVVDVTPQGFQLDLKVGIGYDDNSIISTTIEFNPILLSVDLSSAENALASLASIDDCLKTVNEQLLNIGSIINRLEMVLDEQSIKLENMISSRSTLRDADLAEESSNFIKYQILQEASSTLMASSRGLRYENVIGLLQGLN